MKQTGGTLFGVILGVATGVLISLGVVWYLNKTPLPFVSKATSITPPSTTAAPKPLPGKPGDAPIDADGERKFDFYEILEGKIPPATRQPAPTSSKPAAAAPPPAPTPTRRSDGALYLQAGAFAQENEAESLKAQLAIHGFEARVLKSLLPDRGVMYRVRIGPFSDPQEMNRSSSQLSQNGFPVAIVRVKE